MKIGYRTIKTAVAAPLAVWIAEILQLSSPGSAAIIAVLCVQPTQKRSFTTAWHRTAAGLLSIIFAYVIFEGIGYHPLTVGLLLITFIPVTDALKITPGIITSLVILFHFYAAQEVSIPLIINEILIMAVGIILALILNLYMPSLDKDLLAIKKDIESNYQAFFRDMSLFLRGHTYHLDEKNLNRSKVDFEKATALVQRESENILSRTSDHEGQTSYFSMREVQFHSLERMKVIIHGLRVSVEQAKKIAELFDDLADAIYPENNVSYQLDRVNELRSYFEDDDLPETRKEFEIRAKLFQLLNEVEHYLTIKNKTLTEKDN
ncbi:Uncharacterized membrane protein YgaE, UPF0421/DUF939 family [Pelagirhabdus alkalitolerans]|uniref:Uncharacterized membrane protein YgaE, UPF0421/DUF939 family n=1 Tax=Pelagirhabdus alkalitolerans TaxID=1612202 RepID=A0A1G6HDD7_9BACI|nr:aromatic acid exporter family protein [Pelagirhabdus alkalitolerans]SDB91935.1 Uncharacterized membrane protein YgaE, UPF0421/DUF939 family [Pelagirhabdus alkalitolerans]